jgi:hypothetical protein
LPQEEQADARCTSDFSSSGVRQKWQVLMMKNSTQKSGSGAMLNTPPVDQRPTGLTTPGFGGSIYPW